MGYGSRPTMGLTRIAIWGQAGYWVHTRHGGCTGYTGWYERHGAGTGLYGGRESGVRAVYMVSGVQEGHERHGAG